MSIDAPPRPKQLRYMGELVTAKGDAAKQAAAKTKYWLALSDRFDWLDERAAAFQFTGPHDSYLPDVVRTGITRRLDRVRQLAVEANAWVTGSAKNKWQQAQRCYDEAESVFVSADSWIRLGRADAEKLARRARYQRAGTEANQERAAEAARKYARLATRLRRDHPEWSLAAIIDYLRRNPKKGWATPPSARQLRRYLTDAGLK
jgi:hypothetical protein